METRSDNTEYGLFRSIFGPSPDEPIAELIDIVYTFFAKYFKKDENEKSMTKQVEPIAQDESDSENQSEIQENVENEEKINDLFIYNTAQDSFFDDEEGIMSTSTPVESTNAKQNNQKDSKASNKPLPQENSSPYVINSSENTECLTCAKNPLSKKNFTNTPRDTPSPCSIRDQVLKKSFKERVDRKLKELSKSLTKSHQKSNKFSIISTSPNSKIYPTTTLDTRYAIVKEIRYPDETEVFQFVRYLKRYEPKISDTKHIGLKSFVKMANGVIIPFENIGDHQR